MPFKSKKKAKQAAKVRMRKMRRKNSVTPNVTPALKRKNESIYAGHLPPAEDGRKIGMGLPFGKDRQVKGFSKA
jgi:hypothetical protein